MLSTDSGDKQHATATGSKQRQLPSGLPSQRGRRCLRWGGCPHAHSLTAGPWDSAVPGPAALRAPFGVGCGRVDNGACDPGHWRPGQCRQAASTLHPYQVRSAKDRRPSCVPPSAASSATTAGRPCRARPSQRARRRRAQPSVPWIASMFAATHNAMNSCSASADSDKSHGRTSSPLQRYACAHWPQRAWMSSQAREDLMSSARPDCRARPSRLLSP